MTASSHQLSFSFDCHALKCHKFKYMHDHLLCDCNAKINFSTVTIALFRRSRSRMDSYYFINLTFIFAVNVFFFFPGVCLNSLVILSFWRSVLLRKKLCYFMIMVLSCCDLLAVLTNNPLMALISMAVGKVECKC